MPCTFSQADQRTTSSESLPEAMATRPCQGKSNWRAGGGALGRFRAHVAVSYFLRQGRGERENELQLCLVVLDDSGYPMKAVVPKG